MFYKTDVDEPARQEIIMIWTKITILCAGDKNWPDSGYTLKLVPTVFTIGLDMGFGREITRVFLPVEREDWR